MIFGRSCWVEGACEMLALDPLYVANEGLFIAIVDPNSIEKVLSVLYKNAEGKEASMAGTVVLEHRGQVVMASKVGGKRVVNYLRGEQLPGIC